MNTQCYRSRFKGLNSIVLENESIKAEWLPDYGSKLASLKTKLLHLSDADNEILYQYKKNLLVTPNYADDFTQYDLSGFDECFPTIEECPSPIHLDETVRVPDHGEVWSQPWTIETHTNHSITFSIISKIFGYKLSKTVSLNQNNIDSTYTVTLLETTDTMPFIWTPHALFKVYPDVKFIIPENLNKVISVSDNGGRLGNFGSLHTYPSTHTDKHGLVHLNKMEPSSSRNFEKYYFTSMLKANDNFGFTDKYRKVMLSVDADKVPYLGIWKNQNGFNNDYNFALEPCTGIYDNVAKAYAQNTCAVISKGETYSWNFSIKTDVI